jgi:SAM-dependent methyltransferase
MDHYVYQDHIIIDEKFKNLEFGWKGKSVLDIGCNIGMLRFYLEKQGIIEYTGIDHSKEDIRIGKERNPSSDLRVADLMEYTDYQADVFIAMAVFHHIPEEKLKSFIKKCKADELIFEVPVGNDQKFINREYENQPIYNLRTEEWYMELIENNYGTVEDVVESGARNDSWNQRLIFVCKK